MDTAEAIQSRVLYEAFGNGVAPHSPAWANPVLAEWSERAGAASNIIISPEQAGMLSELRGDAEISQLASVWAMGREVDPLTRWVMYGTSGTETNSKEFVQLLALAQLAEQEGVGPLGSLYFIDTASHPMRGQLEMEAAMYRAMGGEGMDERYLALFRGRVDPVYIEQLISVLVHRGASQDLISRIRSEWEQRCERLEVPADAIMLPPLEEYRAFYESIGMGREMIFILEEAYARIEADERIPTTLGSLRCLLFTECANLLSERAGVNVPVVAVPFDALALHLQWGDLTLEQIRSLVCEVNGGRGDNTAYMSVFNPFSGGEELLMTQQSLSELVNGDELLMEYLQLLQEIPYHVVCRYSHFSGMGYYSFLLTEGLRRSFAFVFDNYEASGPHTRLLTDPLRRAGGELKFASYPRSWVRVKGFEVDENLTFGAAPPLEIMTHLLLDDPEGIQKLRWVVEWLNSNLGGNGTVFFEVGDEEADVSVVADNFRFAQAHVDRTIVDQTALDATAGRLNHLGGAERLLITPHIDFRDVLREEPVRLVVQRFMIPTERENLDEWVLGQEELGNINTQLERRTQEFDRQWGEALAAYYRNRLEAVYHASERLGLFPYGVAVNEAVDLVAAASAPANYIEWQAAAEAGSNAVESFIKTQARVGLKSRSIEATSPIGKGLEGVGAVQEEVINYRSLSAIRRSVGQLVKVLDKDMKSVISAWQALEGGVTSQTHPKVRHLHSACRFLLEQDMERLGLRQLVFEDMQVDQLATALKEMKTAVEMALEENQDSLQSRGVDLTELNEVERIVGGISEMLRVIYFSDFREELERRIAATGVSFEEHLNYENLVTLHRMLEGLSQHVVDELEMGKKGSNPSPEEVMRQVRQNLPVMTALSAYKAALLEEWEQLNRESATTEAVLEAKRRFDADNRVLVDQRNSLLERMDVLEPILEVAVDRVRTILASHILRVEFGGRGV